MKYAFVDYRISKTEEDSLNKLNISCIRVPKSDRVYEAINGHTDIQIFQSSPLKNEFIINKDIDTNFLSLLIKYNVNYSLSKNELKSSYPDDIILNALSTDNILLHKIKNTDPFILSASINKEIINVNQGYTKCSCAIVSNNAFITSDKSISNSLKSKGYDVLLIPPGDIILEGLDYGFIGGCCGLISESEMIFFGSLEKYIYGDLIKDFLKKHNITPIYLADTKLTDRGSIFVYNF